MPDAVGVRRARLGVLKQTAEAALESGDPSAIAQAQQDLTEAVANEASAAEANRTVEEELREAVHSLHAVSP